MDSKYQGVFDAHKAVNEIYVGTNNEGVEQVFLERRHAHNFAGDPSRVKVLNRKTEPSKSAPNPSETDEPDGSEGAATTGEKAGKGKGK